jgi:hypothetical protein
MDVQPSRHHLIGNSGQLPMPWRRNAIFDPEGQKHPAANHPQISQITQISDSHNLRNL